MNKKLLFALWGGLYIFCAGLGFIPDPAGAGQVAMTAAAVIFFLPGALLLYTGKKSGDRKTLKIVCGLSAASLLLTLVLLIVNFLSVGAVESVGNLLYGLLIVVSSPMVCSQYWALSMFGWACLLMVSISGLRKK